MKNKGFTLVELIIVIVFMAIISLLSLPGIMKVLDRSKSTKYEEYETILKNNLELYNLDREIDLWDDESKRLRIVNFNDISISNQDINLGECDVTKLLITKEDGSYDYKACIKCDSGYETQDAVCTTTVAPSCTATVASSGFTNESKTITITPKDNGSGIGTIYRIKNNVDPEIVTNGTYEAEESGLYVFEVTDSSGMSSSTCSVGVSNIDKVGPVCGIAAGASTTWTNDNRTISQACVDTGGSECVKASYSKEYKTSTTRDSITIADNAGNTTQCSYNVYVDKDGPSCGTASGASTTWTSSDRTVTQACSDTGGSGCVKTSYATTYSSSTTSVGAVTIADNAGNTKSCSYNVYVDKDAPTCGTVSGASTTWTNGNRTVTQSCSDTGGSGCVKTSYATTYTTSTAGSSVTIADNAGNTKSCSYNVYVDKDAPYGCSCWLYYGNGVDCSCYDWGSGFGRGGQQSSGDNTYICHHVDRYDNTGDWSGGHDCSANDQAGHKLYIAGCRTITVDISDAVGNRTVHQQWICP